ncbi:MAG: acyl carrier protein [Pseudonocardiaceae bacterium]
MLDPIPDPTARPAATSELDHDRLRDWLIERVAHYLRVDPADIDTTQPLEALGIQSLYALSLSGDIEDHYDVTLDPTFTWDNPTIDGIVATLLAQSRH